MSNNSTGVGTNPSNCQDGDRHCESPIETNLFNIFDRPTDDDDQTIVESDDSTADDGCNVLESNDDGSYGIVNSGDRNENSDGITSQPLNEIIIAFQYQIQTSLPISRFQSSNSSPLVMIEKAISDVLVQNFFSNPQCGPSATKESRQGDTRRRLRNTWIITEGRRMQIGTNGSGWTGLTTNPEDSILPGIAGVTCHTKLVEDATSCFTVGGAFTATTIMGANTSWIESVSKLAIRNAMNQQQLNQVHDQVYDVLYVSDNRGTVIPEPPQGHDIVIPLAPTQSPYSDSSDISRGGRAFVLWPWIFVPLGAVLFCIAMYEFYRHVKRRRIIRGISVIDDSSRPQSPSGSRNSLINRQQNSVALIEYGPFTGSFPNQNQRSVVPLAPYFEVEEYDNNDAYPTNVNRQEFDHIENLIDENVPICSFDGLDVNTSYDTDLYYNSVASSSNNGSSNDTKELPGTRGHFPSNIT